MSSFRAHSSISISPLRLKLAFLAVGTFLLGGLLVLSWFLEQRLAEARRDREEMVASRVFDEMEREISVFLESEERRPNYSDLERTDPEKWAPFVVGYFNGARGEPWGAARIVAAEGATSENRRRTEWAIRQAQVDESTSLERGSPTEGQKHGAVPSPGGASQKVAQETAPKPKDKTAAPEVVQQKKASGSSIVQQLNRAPERRKASPSSNRDEEAADPFSDYSEQF